MSHAAPLLPHPEHPTPRMSIPSGPALALGEWQDSSLELRAGLFMQEFADDALPAFSA